MKRNTHIREIKSTIHDQNQFTKAWIKTEDKIGETYINCALSAVYIVSRCKDDLSLSGINKALLGNSGLHF